jgi:hypothetical protein
MKSCFEHKRLYSSERLYEYYSSILHMAESDYGDQITKSNKYKSSELRYRLRKFVSISEELKKNGYSFIVVNKEVEYIYQIFACGLIYVGRSRDPFKRFGEHLTGSGSGCSSSVIVESAIDNNVAPELKVIDICEVGSTAVEAYWIGSSNCVNSQQYKSKELDFKNSPSSYKCVVARQKLGIEPYEFSSLYNLDGKKILDICSEVLEKIIST